ncbi:MAG: tetratricopeptide repeat protein [Gammaproteobacteria bacterium]|nr:tetratricopeptide repeat protein [Gammaproteobacteria bacterium]
MTGPTLSPNAFERGRALHREGKLIEAAACYREALSQQPDDHRALHWLGVLAQQTGDTRAAESLLRSAIEFAGQEPDYRVGLGLLLQTTGRPREAIDAFRAALKADPGNFQALFRLGLLLHRRGEPAQALQYYAAAQKVSGDDGSLLVNMGALLHQLGRNSESVALCRRAVELKPDLPAAHGNLGNALAALGCHDEAIGAFQRSLTLQPHQPAMYANLGNCLFAGGQLESALHAYENCLRRSPGDVTSLAMVAAIYTKKDRRDLAGQLLDFDALLRIAPVSPPQSQTLAEYLASLHEYLLAHPSLRAGQETGGLLPAQHPTIAHLVSAIRGQVRDYIATRPDTWQPVPGLGSLWQPPEAWRLDMWAAPLHLEAGQQAQIRPSGWLSGLFFVDCSLPAKNSSQLGWIEFGQSADDLCSQSQTPVHRYQPKAGELVLFPSYFYYQSLPLRDDKRGVSICFDIVPRRDPQSPG